MQQNYELITSRQNPLVQKTVSLADRKNREREGLFRFDGKKLFAEALAAKLPLTAVLLRASCADRLLEAAGENLSASTRVVALADALFDRISEEKSPEGVIVICKRLEALHRRVAADRADLLPSYLRGGQTLFLESVRDPGNLGTVIRSAAAFGIANLVISADCADIYHPRTIRAAMGTLFKTPIFVVEDAVGAAKSLAARGRVYGAALDARACRLGKVAFGEGDTVIVGNEGHGLSAEMLAAVTDTLFIPMEPGVESLNAGIAASVLLWELYHG